MSYPNEAEARLALAGVEHARQRVIDRIGMPWWYWWGLAGCWVGLGVLSDVGVPAWIVTAATLVVGAVHASVSQRLLGGRQQTGALPRPARRRGTAVSAPRHRVPRRPRGTDDRLRARARRGRRGTSATGASILVAVVIVLGGPQVMAAIRADATRRAGASSVPRFDELIHPATRLSIMSLLAAADWADFAFVRDQVGLSDSALSKQLATLEEAGYVAIERPLSERRRRSIRG